MSFALDLSKACEKAKGQTELIARNVMLDLFYKVINKSPVAYPPNWQSVKDWEVRKAAGTTKAKSPAYGYVGGTFRGNWNASIGTVDKSVSETKDKSGALTRTKVKAVIDSFSFDGKSIFLANSLPYAIRLEYDSWSKQAPAGMVRLSLTEITNQYGA